MVRLHPLISVCVFSRPQTRSRGATRRPPSRHALRASGSGSDSARTESLASSLGGIGEETTPTKKKSAGTGTPITKRADPFADLISQSDSLPPLPKPGNTYTLVGKRRENFNQFVDFWRPQQVFSLRRMLGPTYIKFLFPSSSPNINYAKFVHIQDHTLDKLEQLQLIGIHFPRLAVVCY